MRLVRFARVRLLRHVLPISLLILRKKTDYFAVYIPRGHCIYLPPLGPGFESRPGFSHLFDSLRRRRNLPLVSNVCEPEPIDLF